ncbi:MBL fold metallo-hydrolase [Salipiger mucosus]|uniref:Zn-dependent hydrolase n=1 Tax=Salipiger mucosus DSM 16094 TaxID=1123237 RepID=S9QDX5_9RHOB|nr:MBL fold metallo-hydrolase [Salipiger mucosus]EPX79621.1 Zn-dependent hydrolase [Salipiger mucosus DSM 16094]
MTHSPTVKSFWDEATGSWQYVFHDPATMKGAVVDPVLDFDPQSGATSTRNAQLILDYVIETGIDVDWILDTHPHADHFSAALWLQDKLGGQRCIGEKVTGVQELWKGIYNFGDEHASDGSQWDRLFAEGDEFMVGEIPVKVLFSPGHTLASITYVAGDAAFVHDTFMMPDKGTTRADFPGGDSAQLYNSLMEILALPDETRLYVGHDYPEGREAQCCATVAEHKAQNVHLKDGPTVEEYQKVRDGRDATLALPDRMLAALQVNAFGTRLPEPESNGKRYLKIPLDQFEAR